MSCVGELGITAITDCEIVINQQLHAFIPSDLINKYFLFYGIKTQKKYIESIATKTAVPYLNKNNCNSISIPLPSIAEQEKIASFLGAIDTRLTQLRRKHKLLQTYKRGVMQKIFSQEVRFKGAIGSEFPEWDKKKLGDICNYLNGKSYEEDIVEVGEYYLITLNSVDIDGNLKSDHKKIDFTDNSLKQGDLVMVLSDVAHGNFLGRTNIIPSNYYVLNQRMGALKPKIKVNTHFLIRYINHSQRYFKLHGQGSSQKNLSKGDVLNFSVHFPTLVEQEKIADFLTAIDQKIEAVARQVDRTEQFKKGLLQKMFV